MNLGKNIFVLIFSVIVFFLCGKTDDKINTMEKIKNMERYFQFTVNKTDGSRIVN